MVIHVYDDEGTLDRVSSHDHADIKQAAIGLIDRVLDWTSLHGGAIYPAVDCRAHLCELEQLKQTVSNGLIDVSEPDWFETMLGFTFSIEPKETGTNRCGKYPEDEVLSDEAGCCSLCGSSMNASGDCLYVKGTPITK